MTFTRAEISKRWREHHPEEQKAAVRNWSQNNKETRNKYMREWNAKNPDKVKANRTKSRKNNPVCNLLRKARYRAKKIGVAFDVTAADFPVIPTHCPVLGIELIYGGNWNERYNAPTFDRIDNTKGYVKGNVIIVSYRANSLKSNATVKELQMLAEFYSRIGN